MEDDVGSALTGQRTDPATAGAKWDDFMQRPGNRQALLQIGLQMMQPVGIGQTAGGHIAQSIGAGGEAVGRLETADLKEQAVDNRLQMANDRLNVAQQNANSNELRATSAASRSTGKQVGGLTDMFRARAEREDKKAEEKEIATDAKNELDSANGLNGLIADPKDPRVMQFKGKTAAQARDIIRAERNAGQTPPAGRGTIGPTQNTAIPPGYVLYSDGVHRKFETDPNSQYKGKYLEWRP